MHREFIDKTMKHGAVFAYMYIIEECDSSVSIPWLSYQLEHIEDVSWEKKFKYLQEIIEEVEKNK